MPSLRRSCTSLWLYSCLLLVSSLVVNPARAERRTLFSFKAPFGARPSSLVRASDGLWYGTTSEGGAHGKGSVFGLAPQGGPKLLYAFTGERDGSEPSALVAGSDGALYGLCALPTEGDAPAAMGLFRLSLDGRLDVLQRLVASDGALLTAAKSGGVYGTTGRAGAIYRVDAASQLQTVYTFQAGSWANTLITGQDGNLYGTTQAAADAPSQIFRFTTSGAFDVLASFPQPADAGSAIVPSAIARDASGDLYVATQQAQQFAIYRLPRKGALGAWTQLDAPLAVLLSADHGVLYGSTLHGGSAHQGSIVRVAADGGKTTLYSFRGESDGATPNALGLEDDSVYGTALDAGAGFGTVFRVSGASGFTTLYSFSYPDGIAPGSLVRGRDGNLYGTTQAGGSRGFGTLFKASADGALQTIHAFAKSDGATPLGLTLGHDGVIYGRTAAGGASDSGTLFSFAADGQVKTLVTFDRPRQGDGPALVQLGDGTLYGADQADSGHLFRVTTQGKYEVVYTFPSLSARVCATPSALIAGSDGALYGATAGAFGPMIPPSFSAGTVFRFDPQSGVFKTLVSFNEVDPSLGASPRTVAWGADGMIYGATSNLPFVCGVFGDVFKLDPHGDTPQLVHAFTGKSDGTGPSSLVQLSSGTWYGITLGGVGLADGSEAASACTVRHSTIFSLIGNALTTLDTLPFAAADSNYSVDLDHATALIDGGDGKLYGVFANGGAASGGELFSLTPAQ